MYRMHRVFCATSWELESERRAFHDVVGEVNAAEAMKHGVLYVPVTLVNMRDKRPFQYVVDENIRDCRYFVLALADGWGPPERDFARDYRLALSCREDPALPMRETVFLWQKSADGRALPAGMPAPAAEFSSPDEFKAHVRTRLREWLAAEST